MDKNTVFKVNPPFLVREYQFIKAIKDDLLPAISNLNTDSPELLQKEIRSLVNNSLITKEKPLLLKRYLCDYLYNSIFGFGIIQPLLDDPEITEIMINNYQQIYVEHLGVLKLTDLEFSSKREWQDMVVGIFARANKELSLSKPIADLRLSDGSRANAVLDPIAPDGPVLTIRKFTGILPSPDVLIKNNCLSEEALKFLKMAIKNKESIFICGGTGAGKTTLLNALSTFIPSSERIITIEDSIELNLRNQPNLVKLEARQSSYDNVHQDISISDLIKTALRMRPDRIIVGEVRGDEAYMLMHAANTGHPGTLSTGHGNNNADMLVRLANMISGCTRLPYPAILRNLVSSINLIVFIKRLENGQRRIIDISRVLDADQEKIHLQTLFKYVEAIDALQMQV